MDPLLEATLQLKVQSYDRKIARRVAQKRFVVGILYKTSDRSSEAAANEMRDAFTRVVESYRIKGIKPTIVTIPFDKAKLIETLTAHEVAMIYVTRGLEETLPTIVEASARLKVPTVSGVREHVTSGCTIGIVVDRRKPKIIINLKSVAATGMELDAEILELAEVVR
jgi:YfiR/HmsC-like